MVSHPVRASSDPSKPSPTHEGTVTSTVLPVVELNRMLGLSDSQVIQALGISFPSAFVTVAVTDVVQEVSTTGLGVM